MDRPPARNKHSRLYKGLLVGMLALILLAASSTLLYKNSVNASSGHVVQLGNSSLSGQTPSTTVGGTTATTDTHTSIDNNGPGTTPFPTPTASGTTPTPGSRATPGFTPTIGATPITSPPVVTPQPTPQPTRTPLPPVPGPHTNLLANPSFEGYSSWCAYNNNAASFSCNGPFSDSATESGSSHSGSWHRVNGYVAADVTTYQMMPAPVTGNYYASVWIETGCNTTGTYFFIKNAHTGSPSNVINVRECVQTWTLFQVGPFAINKGDPLAIELRSINNANQWARFDDANMWYQ